MDQRTAKKEAIMNFLAGAQSYWDLDTLLTFYLNDDGSPNEKDAKKVLDAMDELGRELKVRLGNYVQWKLLDED